MRVLVACEFSGVVAKAFRDRGHYALSCDLIPTELEQYSRYHWLGDVREILHKRWDLMIGHPPCTYLAASGVRWLHTDEERWSLMEEGAQFFYQLLNAPIKRIAIENPKMHKYAVEIIGRRQDQTIQPWQFGHHESKATGLWLKGLQPLEPTKNVYEEMMKLPVAQRNAVHYAGPGINRWRIRSRTYQGIADAMAQQWG